MLEDTELSCVRSLSLGASGCLGTAWAGSAVAEQMGEAWSHFRLLAEWAPGGGGGARSTPLRTLPQAGGWLTVRGPTSAVVIPGDSCRKEKPHYYSFKKKITSFFFK